MPITYDVMEKGGIVPDNGNLNQIEDAVSETTVKVIGELPSLIAGNLAQALAANVGIALQNATASQQSMNELGIAVVASAIALLPKAEVSA